MPRHLRARLPTRRTKALLAERPRTKRARLPLPQRLPPLTVPSWRRAVKTAARQRRRKKETEPLTRAQSSQPHRLPLLLPPRRKSPLLPPPPKRKVPLKLPLITRRPWRLTKPKTKRSLNKPTCLLLTPLPPPPLPQRMLLPRQQRNPKWRQWRAAKPKRRQVSECLGRVGASPERDMPPLVSWGCV